jgi:hypothetical protein
MAILLTESVNHCVSRPDNMPDQLLAQGISLQATGSPKRRDESQATMLIRRYRPADGKGGRAPKQSESDEHGSVSDTSSREGRFDDDAR